MPEDTTRPQPLPRRKADDLDDQIDQLTPVPGRGRNPVHQRMDGPMDTLLPTPGDDSHAADDATTQEELEVDTTADGIDDRIDPAPPQPQGNTGTR